MKQLIYVRTIPHGADVVEIDLNDVPVGFAPTSEDPMYTFTGSHIIVAQKCYVPKKETQEDKEIKKAAILGILH